MYTTSATLLALAALVSAREGHFVVNRFYGQGPLFEGRVDPIVSPGQVSGHTHTVMGGNAFAMDMGDDTALGASCTNSFPRADLSNYWFPKLYFQDPGNGSFTSVPFYYANVYYFFDATDDEMVAFPPGLKMVAGQQTLRSPPASGHRQVIDHSQGDINPARFMCSSLDSSVRPFGDSPDQFSGTGFPDANCDQTYTPLRYDVHFPSCYNPAVPVGDHENNMDWPTNGNCPAGWHHVPHIFLEVYWDTPQFAGQWTPGQGQQPFVLAQGDTTGYGLHADFISGWDEQALQGIIDSQCNAGHAGFQGCPGIDQYGGVYPDGAPACTMQGTDEQVNGVLDALPGCNPLTSGPEDAEPQTGGDCGGSGGGSSGGSGGNGVNQGNQGNEGEQDTPAPSESSSPVEQPPAVTDAPVQTPSPDAPQAPSPTTFSTAVSVSLPPSLPVPSDVVADDDGPARVVVGADGQGNAYLHTVYVTNVVTENVYVTAAPVVKHRRHVHGKRHGHGHFH